MSVRQPLLGPQASLPAFVSRAPTSANKGGKSLTKFRQSDRVLGSQSQTTVANQTAESVSPGTAGVLACIPHTDTSKLTDRRGCTETVGGSDCARHGAESVNGI
jgi:hypothetical protein